LSRKDIRPILVDWGDMSAQERTFNLTDYIEKDLKPILELLSPRPIYLVGYCMGGLMATALAQITQKIKGLVLLATPWNFHTDNTWMVPYLHASSDMLEQAIDLANELPGEVIQLLFNSLNPMSFVKKFRSLGQS
ncbi:Poly-beta-hydroxybutyrate polymerase, partial [mine drainage metagenome]